MNPTDILDSILARIGLMRTRRALKVAEEEAYRVASKAVARSRNMLEGSNRMLDHERRELYEANQSLRYQVRNLNEALDEMMESRLRLRTPDHVTYSKPVTGDLNGDAEGDLVSEIIEEHEALTQPASVSKSAADGSKSPSTRGNAPETQLVHGLQAADVVNFFGDF